MNCRTPSWCQGIAWYVDNPHIWCQKCCEWGNTLILWFWANSKFLQVRKRLGIVCLLKGISWHTSHYTMRMGRWKPAALQSLPSVHILKVELTFKFLTSSAQGGWKAAMLLLLWHWPWERENGASRLTLVRATKSIPLTSPGESRIEKARGNCNWDQTPSTFPIRR